MAAEECFANLTLHHVANVSEEVALRVGQGGDPVETAFVKFRVTPARFICVAWGAGTFDQPIVKTLSVALLEWQATRHLARIERRLQAIECAIIEQTGHGCNLMHLPGSISS